MPFIPHTPSDVETMLATIGVSDIDQLFDEIPAALRIEGLPDVPAGQNEMAVSRLMREMAARDGTPLCFAGAGAYEHHIPAAIWQITTRGEFYSAYTPYQAEASQGTLQVIYEYQTMMAELMAMDVSNASMYDGASSLAEAILMAIRANRKSKASRVLVPMALNPLYRRVLDTLLEPLEIQIDFLDFDPESGQTPVDQIRNFVGEDITAVVICQPNYFGTLEQVHELTDAAHELGALVVAQANPMAMAILEAPGNWGEQGADIACGEGQPLGVPLSSGGPYFGFLTCKQAYVRQMPGRLVGRTLDLDGKPGFTLTLQAREQHIRRAKATSNICTNQGLMVTAATIYMAMMGPHGLEQVATASHGNLNTLVSMLEEKGLATRLFGTPVFHEAAVSLKISADKAVAAMAEHGILAGVSLGTDYSNMDNGLLICATETKTEADLERYVNTLAEVANSA